jgi:hypothetical protein
MGSGRSPVIRPDEEPGDLDLRYLKAELSRLDLRLEREVRRWQLAGQDPADSFRGLYVSDPQADALLQRPLCSNWGAAANPDALLSAEFQSEDAQAARQAKAIAAACSTWKKYSP